MPSDASRRLHQRALRSIPTGTHSNSRVASPHPLYFASASGATLVDVDGRRWTDYVMGNGAVILGHGDEHVTEAIAAALREGLGAGVESELAIAAAEAFLRMVPTADRVRFTNTGTEAIMHAVHIARAATGRSSLAKIEGAYHGWWDEVFVSTWPDPTRAGEATRPQALPGSPGLRGNIVDATVVVPFNDLEATRRILSEGHDVAALVIEPVMIDIGYVEPDPGYLAGLRELTKSLGIVLIFDELLTGFRVHAGGVQGRDGVVPDLSTWGKALANGFPIAALAGTAEMMARSEPGAGNAAFVGTFNGYRPALAACIATLERLADGRVIGDLQKRSRAFAEAFEAVGKAAGVPVRLHSGGGHFQPYFTETPVRDYRSAATTDARVYDRWRTGLDRRGAIVASKALLHCAFSAAHTDDDLSALLDATRDALTTKETHHA